MPKLISGPLAALAAVIWLSLLAFTAWLIARGTIDKDMIHGSGVWFAGGVVTIVAYCGERPAVVTALLRLIIEHLEAARPALATAMLAPPSEPGSIGPVSMSTLHVAAAPDADTGPQTPDAMKARAQPPAIPTSKDSK